MARGYPALQATTGGSVPPDSQRELQHPESQQQALLTRAPQAIERGRDEVTLGLRLGNWIAAAVYGPRGEHRG